LAKEKKLAYNVVVDESLPETLNGDSARIKQIMINLISNAVKFTDTGTVEVSVSKADDDHWKLTVKDSGIGIPSHALEYIFDEFRQVDGGSTRQFGGTGLGLAIVRNLTTLMHGTVNASSRLDEGSVFTVTLPMEVAKMPLSE
jgi:signal transduction histidine kinase